MVPGADSRDPIPEIGEAGPARPCGLVGERKRNLRRHIAAIRAVPQQLTRSFRVPLDALSRQKQKREAILSDRVSLIRRQAEPARRFRLVARDPGPVHV